MKNIILPLFRFIVVIIWYIVMGITSLLYFIFTTIWTFNVKETIVDICILFEPPFSIFVTDWRYRDYFYKTPMDYLFNRKTYKKKNNNRHLGIRTFEN